MRHLALEEPNLMAGRKKMSERNLWIAAGLRTPFTKVDGALAGRDAILASYQARPAQRITRHFCSNIRVQVESAERARISTYVQVFAADTQHAPDGHFGWPLAGRTMIGEFDDLCVLDQGAWRFAERHARFVMHRDG